MHPTDLAWAVVDVVGGRLAQSERFDIHLALGAGEVDDALMQLLRIVVREQIPLSDDLVGELSSWVQAYHAADDECRTLIALARSTRDPTVEEEALPRYLPVQGRYHRVRRTSDG